MRLHEVQSSAWCSPSEVKLSAQPHDAALQNLGWPIERRPVVEVLFSTVFAFSELKTSTCSRTLRVELSVTTFANPRSSWFHWSASLNPA